MSPDELGVRDGSGHLISTWIPCLLCYTKLINSNLLCAASMLVIFSSFGGYEVTQTLWEKEGHGSRELQSDPVPEVQLRGTGICEEGVAKFGEPPRKRWSPNCKWRMGGWQKLTKTERSVCEARDDRCTFRKLQIPGDVC